MDKMTMKLEDITALMDDRQHSVWGKNSAGKTFYRKVPDQSEDQTKKYPLTSDMLAAHVEGKVAYGGYTHVDKERTKSHVLIFDMDDHKKEGVALGPTLEVVKTLRILGIPHLIFRSGGGWGYHLWMFFEEAVHWKSLHEFATSVLNAVDEDKARYVIAGSGNLNQKKTNARGVITHIEHAVEVIPKGAGEQNIAIPCGRESIPMRLVKDGSIIELVPCALEDLTIEFVPMPEKVVDPEDLGAEDRDAAFDCYIRAFSVDDYAKWGAAGLGLVAAFGKDFKEGDGSKAEWAYNRWVEWTKTSGKFEPGDEDQWKGFKPKKFGPFGFWRIARQNGYRGPWPGSQKKVSEDALELFNERWAVVDVDGKAEFLNMKTGKVSNVESFMILTEPEESLRNSWRKWSRRRSFNGYTFASPNYQGDKWNLFRGWPVEPEDGDASLWEKYVVELLCRGDKDLAHWVMTFIADAVQEPWSARPGSGIALRGPQGSGKSFLGKGVRAALGNLALELHNAERATQQFNDLLVQKTVLCCEEAFFTGSPQQKEFIKNLITGDTWTFEPKGRKSFTTQNIFRVIATTNRPHAISIDNDDRRWTIIESKPVCPYAPGTRASDEWWAPYYALLHDHPGRVLRYLMDYKVDKALIRNPYLTEAKMQDKVSSDPLLQVLIHMVETGTCPDDLRGDGRVASGAIYDRIKARGGRWTSPQALANELRTRFAAKTARGCIRITRVEMKQDSSGIITPVIVKRTDYDGLQMPPLSELRVMVSQITGQPHDGPESWVAFEPDTPEHVVSDPNGGDARAVERAAAKRFVIDGGQVAEEDIPF